MSRNLKSWASALFLGAAFALPLVVAVASPALAQTAVLLPNGKQQFLDSNGDPLAGGHVFMYVPTTTTFKNTWVDPTQSVLNTNPITLDAAGEAVIYGSGQYRQLLLDVFGNTIWDQLTYGSPGPWPGWGGTSTGSANAQVVTQSSFTAVAGSQIAFRAGFSNTSATTLTVGALGPYSVFKDGLTGPVALTGGEIVAGNIVLATYDSTLGNVHIDQDARQTDFAGTLTNIAGAATIDLGTAGSHNVNVTGSAWTATSLGSSASTKSPLYKVTFAASGTLTYNSTSLILPNGVSMAVSAGQVALFEYLGSGNWKMDFAPQGGGYLAASRQVLTATGNYTPTAGTAYIHVQGCAAGGGGGGANASAGTSAVGGGGGGGGEGGDFYLAMSGVSTPIAYVIGAGGTAGVAATGGTGGLTSFGALMSLTGGTGGNGQASANIKPQNGGAGGTGGSITAGGQLFAGQGGTAGAAATAGAASDVTATGGQGGSGIFGSGARGVAVNNTSTAGVTATGFCGGASGGASTNSNGTANGGVGAPGIIIVDEYR